MAFGDFGDTASLALVQTMAFRGSGDTPNSVLSGDEVGFFDMIATSSAVVVVVAAA